MAELIETLARAKHNRRPQGLDWDDLIAAGHNGCNQCRDEVRADLTAALKAAGMVVVRKEESE